MLRKIVTVVIIIPIAVVIIAFALANRQAVTVSFDPFSSTAPAYAATLPLFVIVFTLLILGVIVGGVAAWLGQSQWRRAARRLDGEVRALQQDLAAARSRYAATFDPPAKSAAPPARPAIPPPAA